MTLERAQRANSVFGGRLDAGEAWNLGSLLGRVYDGSQGRNRSTWFTWMPFAGTGRIMRESGPGYETDEHDGWRFIAGIG